MLIDLNKYNDVEEMGFDDMYKGLSTLFNSIDKSDYQKFDYQSP